MTKILALFLVAMICTSLQTTYAASFECSDEPADCKTKFGQQFERDFKERHLSSTRDLLIAFTLSVESIISELPADDPHLKVLKDSMHAVSTSLQKLNGNLGDGEKIPEIMGQAMNSMLLNMQGIPTSSAFNDSLEKHNLKKPFSDIMHKFTVDIGNLWAEMYAGLRESDLKTYPEYVEVNEHMENLRADQISPSKLRDYAMAAEVLDVKFNLPYFGIVYNVS